MGPVGRQSLLLSWRAFGFAAYVIVSVALAIILLVVDPLIDKPSGLIKLRWFTKNPPSHGFDACSWDYEGSWRIGLASGSPDPLHLNFSSEPVLTCATVHNTSVSFVADPFLFVPNQAATTSSHSNSTTGSMLAPEGLPARHLPPPMLHLPAASWYAFYEMKNLRRYIGEIGVAVSTDQGLSWTHLGTALAEPFHLSFPLIQYDGDSGQFLMFAETSGAGDGAIRVYGTSPAAFPFGWELVQARQPYDPGWPAARRWFQFGAAAKYVDTAPVWFGDRWWIYTSRVGTPAAGQPKYTLLLYTATSLLGEWTLHPSTLASEGSPYGIDVSRRTARNGGRPFVLDGQLYRWAQDCSRYYGEGLVLMRAYDGVLVQSYREEEVVRYEPTRQTDSWRGQRLHHADVHRRADGTWLGLADGDRHADGHAHFVAREQWFVDLKPRLGHLLLLQLAVVGAAVALPRLLGSGPSTSSSSASGILPLHWLTHGSSDTHWVFSAARRLRLRWPALGPLLAKLGVVAAPGGGQGGGGARGGAGGGAAAGGWGLLGSLLGVTVTAAALSVCTLWLAPRLVYCPSWLVKVRPFPASPHFVPDQPFVDPAAPYNVSGLTVITGCSQSFVDRLENLVGSLQVWAPSTPVVVFDLGFTSEQLARIRCWKGVQVRWFPWERYPPHVRDVSTYAFKALAFQLALREVAPAVLWLDCGLEVRAPLDPLLDAMSRLGHVTAQQSTSPGKQGWPLGHFAERYTRRFLNMTDAEYERVKLQPFCAAGMQGYVAGSAAERLLLQPVVQCSLDRDACIAPPGHTRDQHCYDQTAFTLLLRHHNFTSCLQRELYATSSTHKTRYDPRQSSAPLVIASRRHRQPKPYSGLLRRNRSCRADPGSNPWRSVSSEHLESTARHSSLSGLAKSYAQMLVDFAVQAGCCLGVHLLAQALLWGQVLLCSLGLAWPKLRHAVHFKLHGWLLLSAASTGLAALSAAVLASTCGLV